MVQTIRKKGQRRIAHDNRRKTRKGKKIKRTTRTRRSTRRKYKKRIKRKTSRRTKRKNKRSVKRYNIQKGGGLPDYGEGHANTCLHGAIETAVKFMAEIDMAADEYEYLPSRNTAPPIKVSFIRHSESTSNTQFGNDRGGKAKALAIAAGGDQAEANDLDWGGDRGYLVPHVKKNKNEMYWGYTHAFLTEYGRMQAYSTGYYKLWEMFCNGDYDMDFFCSVLPRACQSAKLASAGFIQRLEDAKEALANGTFDDFMEGSQSHTIDFLKLKGQLDLIIDYYNKKTIKIINGISELPAELGLGVAVPYVSETQRCMRVDLLPDMVKFLNGIELGRELVLDGLNPAFTGEGGAREAPGDALDRPRNYEATQGSESYMTTEDSVFGFLLRLPHWLQRTDEEKSTLQPHFFHSAPVDETEIRNICFVHGLMMGEYMPWPLFTGSIKEILAPSGTGVRPAGGAPEPEPSPGWEGSGEAGPEPMEEKGITGVENARRYFHDIDFHEGLQWPYTDEVGGEVEERAEEYEVDLESDGMRKSFSLSNVQISSDGMISLNGDPIRMNRNDDCSIEKSKEKRSGRPYFIVIAIGGEGASRRQYNIDTKDLENCRRFLRDAMCVECLVEVALLPNLMKEHIFEVLLSELKGAAGELAAEERRAEEEEAPETAQEGEARASQTKAEAEARARAEAVARAKETFMSKFLFYGKLKSDKFTAETVNNAIKAVGLPSASMKRLLLPAAGARRGPNEFDTALSRCYRNCMESLTLVDGGDTTGWEGVLRSIDDYRDAECFESSFKKQPPNATCVSFQLDNFPRGEQGLLLECIRYVEQLGKKYINFWSLFLHRDVSGVSFQSPPLRLKKPMGLGEGAAQAGGVEGTQLAYNLLAAQIKKADVNNYYHTNPMILMIFKEVSRHEEQVVGQGGEPEEMLSNLRNRCVNIREKALDHVKADTDRWYFPTMGGRKAQLEEIFGGGWENGWGVVNDTDNALPVFVTSVTTPPAGQCLKENPKKPISHFQNFYAKIEERVDGSGYALNIYTDQRRELDQPRGSSLTHLGGLSVSQVYDSGHPGTPFQIEISGVTALNSRSHPTNNVFKINFSEIELANTFYIELWRLSKLAPPGGGAAAGAGGQEEGPEQEGKEEEEEPEQREEQGQVPDEWYYKDPFDRPQGPRTTEAIKEQNEKQSPPEASNDFKVKAPGTDTYVSFSDVEDKLEDARGRMGAGWRPDHFKI